MTVDEHERYNIGTYKEKKLHRILKYYFEENSDFHEVPFEGFIADIKKENQIIEIETSGFVGLRDKLEAFLPTCRVTLVYPIAASSFISWIDPDTGLISPKRKSPKKENIYNLLYECIYIADYLTHPNLQICGISMEMQEYRLLDGWSKNKKRGSHRYERIPGDVFEIFTFDSPENFFACIPENCQDPFTIDQFCQSVGTNRYTGRAILKVFEKVGVVEPAGKEGRRLLFRCTGQ